jgi:hypothetical protein
MALGIEFVRGKPAERAREFFVVRRDVPGPLEHLVEKVVALIAREGAIEKFRFSHGVHIQSSFIW